MAINETKEFENCLKQILDDSLDDIDSQTTDKLYAARQKALRAGVQKNKQYKYPMWLSGAIMTASMAVLVLTIVSINTPQAPVLDVEKWGELATANEDEIDLYAELDFYQWLEENHG